MNDPIAIPVALEGRGYEVIVGSGLLEAAAHHLAPVLGGRRRLIVVTDTHVAARHLDRLRTGLAGTGMEILDLIVPPGEATKSWAGLSDLTERLLALNPDRGTLVAALGGGVVGDLAGFAAAITLRGIDYVQLPTTLLAQVDSSVGGKTAINAGVGKNLVGAFHQPIRVLADIDCLATLSARDLRAGYAEVVKYAVLGDAPFFDWLEAHGPALLAGDSAARTQAVVTSVRAKARIVAADEREAGQRALLNLGHTFGHALEAETGFSDRLLHGEGVGIGMVLALALSAPALGCPIADRDRLIKHLLSVGMPVAPSDCGLEPACIPSLLASMARDKKARDGRMIFILCRRLGESTVESNVASTLVTEVLESNFAPA